MSLVAIELATAYVSIIPDTSKIAPAIKKEIGGVNKGAESSGKGIGGKLASGIGTGLKTGAKVAGGAVAGILGGALVKGFGRLNSIEQAEAKLRGLGHSGETVTGIMDNALASVKGTSFGLDEAGTVAASAVASGVKPGKDLERTLKLVADSATIAGTDMNSMGAIFNKIAASNRLGMEEVNQLSDRGIPILQMIAEQYGVTAQEAREMVSRGEVDFANFQTMMEENLGGAALESGKTVQGAWKNMGAALGRVGANLLSGIFPQLTGGFGGVTELLDNMGPTAEKVGKAIGDALAWAAEHVGTFVQQFKDGEGAGGTFRDILTAIKDVIVTVATWIKEEAVPAIQNFIEEFKNGEGPGGKVRDVLESIGDAAETAFTWLKDEGLPALKSLWDFVQKKLWPDLKDAFLNHILPAAEELGRVIKKAWEDVIQPALSALWTFIKDTLAPFLADFYENGVKPTFQGISDVIKFAWNNIIKPVFSNLKDGLVALKDAFVNTKDGIASAWDKVTGAIKGPLMTALTWINDNFIKPLNTLLEKIGVSFRIPLISLSGFYGKGAKGVSTAGGPVRAFATGGVLPGYTPGRDVHRFYSPSGGLLDLSGGEAVMRPEWTRALGKGTVDAWNAAARSGGVAGVRKAMGFASGGIIGRGWNWIKKKGTDFIDVASSVGKVLMDPLGSLREFAQSILSRISDNPLVKALTSVITKVAEGVANKVLNFGSEDGSGGPGGAMRWQAIWSMIKAVAPEARMTSNYRPGAIAASGLPSKHGAGRAVDLVSSNMMATFNKIKPIRPWTELIYSPAGARQMLNGRNFNGWSPITRRMHYDHIHAAMAKGGVIKPFVADSGVTLAPGINVVHNKLGKPEPLARTDQMPRGDVHVHLEVENLRSIQTVEEFLQMVDVQARMQAGVRR